ncbi:MAG: proline dehydrogenase family protein [Acidobacteriota bacterium]|nr:proline dehydrogenase family protein [Acidobacteriota bacterium]
MDLFSRFIVTTLPLVPRALVGHVAQRYVAGDNREEALDVVRRLNGEGAMATLDLLGEEVAERPKAEAAVEEYLGLFRDIDCSRLDANVSIKLTLLGLKIDEGFCRDNVRRIAETAGEFGNFVRIDMEDSSCTDPTLRIYRSLQAELGNLGVVFQAYMRRLGEDMAALPPEGANVRLCKGIYIEPRKIAWKGFETVRANFVAVLEGLIRRGVYVGIATHDEFLVCEAERLIESYGLSRDRYEFQMLLGVDRELRTVLIDRGHRMRVYVPYGADWYPYSVRRLRENPAVAKHVIRAMFGLRPTR